MGLDTYFKEQVRESSGLPVVPPTEEKVEEFLRFTDREAGELLGIGHPDHRKATPWNTAGRM